MKYKKYNNAKAQARRRSTGGVVAKMENGKYYTRSLYWKVSV